MSFGKEKFRKILLFPVVIITLLFMMTSSVYALSFPIKYSSKTASLTIRKKVYYGTTCYVAHLKLKPGGYKRFKGGVSKKLGGETTKKFAKRVNAVFAINGDYAYCNGYTCVRNGVVYKKGSINVSAVYNSNTGKLTSSGVLPKNQSLLELGKSGQIYQTFNFGAPFLENGKITLKKNMNQKNGKGRPRAFIGTTEKAGDIFIVATEGAGSNGTMLSDGKSYGLTGYQCARVLKNLGCKFGVPLDGGGSVQMIYKGKAVNRVDKISYSINHRRYEPRKLFDYYYLSR